MMPAKKGKKEEVRERRAKAFELRKAGVTFRQIGKQLGISDAQASRDVTAFLANVEKLSEKDASEMKRLSIERLDTALMAIWQKVKAGDLRAIDRLLRIEHRRAELCGLDAPAKSEVSQQVTQRVFSYDESIATVAPRPGCNCKAPGHDKDCGDGAKVG